MYETLYYAAMLRLPQHMDHDAKTRRVDTVITALGLSSCKDTIIGKLQALACYCCCCARPQVCTAALSPVMLPLPKQSQEHCGVCRLHFADCLSCCLGGFFRKGISGGERKRASIGHELLINPSILLLDEPTSVRAQWSRPSRAVRHFHETAALCTVIKFGCADSSSFAVPSSTWQDYRSQAAVWVMSHQEVFCAAFLHAARRSFAGVACSLLVSTSFCTCTCLTSSICPMLCAASCLLQYRAWTAQQRCTCCSCCGSCHKGAGPL